MLRDNVETRVGNRLTNRAQNCSCSKSRSAKNTFLRGFVNVAGSPDARREKKDTALPSISIIQVHPRRHHIFTSAASIKFHPRGPCSLCETRRGENAMGCHTMVRVENEGVSPKAKVTRTLSSSSCRRECDTRRSKGGTRGDSEEEWR